jgi:hypothetical protein
LKNKNLH